MPRYRLQCHNDSTLQGAFCLFWADAGAPSTLAPLFSPAWRVKRAYPGVVLVFDWDDTYCLIWGESAAPEPGELFAAQQSIAADPFSPGKNGAGLSHDAGGFRFRVAPKSTPEGKLGIYTDASIPGNSAALGIGVGDSPALLCAALSNLNYVFDLTAELWAVFGDFRQGEILEYGLTRSRRDLRAHTDPVRVIFEKNVYEKTLTLQPDNTLLVSRTEPLDLPARPAQGGGRGGAQRQS